MSEINREAWLTELGKRIEPVFAGTKLLPYRVTCGWPCHRALSTRRRVVGQCFGAESSKDGKHELFISPLLDAPLEVAGTLCHEMTHVAAGVQASHGPGFVKIANFIGLTKFKPTAAMPGQRLEERIQKELDKIGPYPHSAIVPIMTRKVRPKTHVSLVCSECQCRIQISIKWLETSGVPSCGCGASFVSS